VRLEVIPLTGIPDVRPGDDLAGLLADATRTAGLEDGDVLVVTQKVVSKAEGSLVSADDRSGWVDRETKRVVARRGDLVIAETRHGFVCANAGVDASNVEPGFLSLLPEDPDASAEEIRARLCATRGLETLGVVITDTFGRPWREGLVDVAIGVAGVPAVVDLRGTTDHGGRELEATIVALADQVAAAAGAVMRKADRIPAALVRGLRWEGAAGRGSDLIRAPDEDLFRESPLQALHARRTIRSFGEGGVPRGAIEEAVRAACTAPAPHHTRPWLFVALDEPASKRALLAGIGAAWRKDLERDGTPDEVVARRIARSDEVLGGAATLIVPFVRFDRSHAYPDAERAGAEREMFLLSGGAAIQNLMLALHAQGYGSCWISSTLFCQEETRALLGLEDAWYALGTIACGTTAGGGVVRPRPPLSITDFLAWRETP
jgi:dehydro coenzyme F420 reductase / coenzyme F420-0:L-glutamate ligase / coenzyme F420-1:gamma-L-glutamate ligase